MNMSEVDNVSIEDLKLAIQEVRERNRKNFAYIEAREQTLDPYGVMLTRLNVLIDFIMPVEKQKLFFEYSFELTMEKQLEAAVSEVNKSLLLDGVNGIDLSQLKKQQ